MGRCSASTVDGKRPGDALAGAGKKSVRVSLRSPFPVDRLELVQNGRVIKAFKLTGDRTRYDWNGDVDGRGRRMARTARLQRLAASLGA